jgi:hypothetical protein
MKLKSSDQDWEFRMVAAAVDFSFPYKITTNPSPLEGEGKK